MFSLIVGHMGLWRADLRPQGGALSGIEVAQAELAMIDWRLLVAGWWLVGKMVCLRRLEALRARYAGETRRHRQIAIALFTLLAWPYFWVIIPPKDNH